MIITLICVEVKNKLKYVPIGHNNIKNINLARSSTKIRTNKIFKNNPTTISNPNKNNEETNDEQNNTHINRIKTISNSSAISKKLNCAPPNSV